MRICYLPQDAFTTTLQIVKYLPTYTQNSSWPVEKHNLTPVRCSDSAVGSDRSLNMAWRQSLPTHYRNQFRFDTPTDRSAITHSAQHTCKSCLHTHYSIQHAPAQAQWMTWLYKSDEPKSCMLVCRRTEFGCWQVSDPSDSRGLLLNLYMSGFDVYCVACINILPWTSSEGAK